MPSRKIMCVFSVVATITGQVTGTKNCWAWMHPLHLKCSGTCLLEVARSRRIMGCERTGNQDLHWNPPLLNAGSYQEDTHWALFNSKSIIECPYKQANA